MAIRIKDFTGHESPLTNGHRMCPGCGAAYHISRYHDANCCKCNSKLYQRDDDKAETVENRLRVYQKQTAPLIEYYEKKGLLRTVDASGTPEEVDAVITALLR